MINRDIDRQLIWHKKWNGLFWMTNTLARGSRKFEQAASGSISFTNTTIFPQLLIIPEQWTNTHHTNARKRSPKPNGAVTGATAADRRLASPAVVKVASSKARTVWENLSMADATRATEHGRGAAQAVLAKALSEPTLHAPALCPLLD